MAGAVIVAIHLIGHYANLVQLRQGCVEGKNWDVNLSMTVDPVDRHRIDITSA